MINIKNHNGAKDHVKDAATVGLTVFAMLNMITHASGGCINPAVGLI